MTKAELRDMRESRVTEFRQSGMSVRAWCLKQQVSLCQILSGALEINPFGRLNFDPLKNKTPTFMSF